MIDLNNPQTKVQIYIPKHVRTFFTICQQYASERFPDDTFSNFMVKCLRFYINKLSPEEKKHFNKCFDGLIEKQKPSTTEFVDTFIKEM